MRLKSARLQLLKYNKKVLQAIRDSPSILVEGRSSIPNAAVTTLSIILETARYSIEKKDSEEAIGLLEKYLIPKRKAHKTRPLPVRRQLILIRELMAKLAEHLSRKCKEELKYGTYLEENKWIELVSWAKENENRLSHLSEVEIKTLVSEPRRYAD